MSSVTPSPARDHPLRAALIALAAGVVLWWTVGWHDLGTVPQRVALGIAVLLALLPSVRRAVVRLLDRIRHPSPKRRFIASVAVTVIVSLYLLLTAWLQHRPFVPKFHDDFMYLLQMQHLAHGRLWYPPHPVAEAFESFHIFHTPVYAAIYFPGTALLLAPTVWLHVPYWIGSVLVCGAVAGLLYRVTAELIDGAAGAIAVILLVGVSAYRYLSLVPYSHQVVAMWGLLMVWALLRWRQSERRKPAWALLIGAFAGWAAITRPVDAIAYAAPVGIAMVMTLARASGGMQMFRRLVLTGVVVIAGALPFLSLQLIENKGITGQWLTTPYRLYVDTYTPQAAFGFHDFDPSVRPKTSLLQKQIYYDIFTVPVAEEHRTDDLPRQLISEKIPRIAFNALPATAMLMLAPLVLLMLRRDPTRTRWILPAVVPLYILLYSGFAYLIRHYVVVVAPPLIFCVVGGAAALPQAMPRAAGFLTALLTLTLAGVSIASLHEIDPRIYDDLDPRPLMDFIGRELPKHVRPPAIVLFKFRPENNPHAEPVYNVDVPWPDEAPIIRAHDLGDAENLKLMRYYAARQPDRNVYTFERLDGVPMIEPSVGRLIQHGTVRQYLAQLERRAATQPATARGAEAR